MCSLFFSFSSGSHALQQHHESTAWSIPPSCTTSPRSAGCHSAVHSQASMLVQSFCMWHVSSLPPYRAAFSSTDVSSAIWPSQSLGLSSHLQSWHGLANRKASRPRWATAKSLRVSSPVSFCYSKGLDAVTDFQLLCGLKNCGLGLWRQTHTHILHLKFFFFV